MFCLSDVILLSASVFVFNDTAPTEIYTTDTLCPYTTLFRSTTFHEPLVMFGYLAAVTRTVELVTGVIVLPQRQTALVAKQAAEVDLLSGGRLRFRSEEHTSELQSLMRISYAAFCLKTTIASANHRTTSTHIQTTQPQST